MLLNQIQEYKDLMEEREMDWFDLYWGKKKLEHNVDGLKHQTPEKIAAFAKEVEKQAAGFWKFKAKNILRIM